MVFALYGLAAVMVAGGSWSVVQGLALVVLERGWTMVIAGSVVATGGILLFAVARAIAGLNRIEAAMQRGLERMARQGLADAPPRPSLSGLAAAMSEPAPVPAPPAAGPATGGPATGGPATGLAAGLGAAAVAGAMGQGAAAAEPRPFEPPRPAEPPRLPERPSPGDADPEPAAPAPLPPDPLLADAPLRSSIVPTPEPTPPAGERGDEFGFAGLLRGTQDAPSADPLLADAPVGTPRTAVHFDEPVVEEPRTAVHFEEPVVVEEPVAEEPRPAEVVEEPVVAEEPVPEPEPAAPADEGPAEELTVIGTYSSGGNTYVMYSDGSIQAETPTGRYTFASLEELKDFIAGGGEAPADGARA